MKPLNIGLSVVVFLLLCTELVRGQLDAVGAVLSVVPVTSILATAGLVGVKLAALSRLLQVLGYDQAYLASGGSGTAAQPIGLQKHYAYMFPYVPGLNVTIKGEHGTSYQNLAAQQNNPGTRKTFPSMMVPGDYEHQNRPFRGSETLKEIFRQSGLKVRFPNSRLSGLPSEGKGPIKVAKDPQPIYATQNTNQLSSSSSLNIPPSSSSSLGAPLPPQPQPLESQQSHSLLSQIQQPPQQTLSTFDPTPSTNDKQTENLPPNNPQIMSQQLSSSRFPVDQSNQQQQLQSQPPIQQQPQQLHIPQTQHLRKPDQISQVNMPHHSLAHLTSPSSSSQDHFTVATTNHAFTLSPNYTPFLSSTPPTTFQSPALSSFPPSSPSSSSAQAQPGPPPLRQNDGGYSWSEEFHPIPQHEQYHQMILAHQKASSKRPNDPLAIGQMLKPLEPVSNAFEDVDKLFEATGPHSRVSTYNNNDNNSRDESRPTISSGTISNNNIGPVQNEYFTNLVPSPMVNDAPFSDEIDHNEYNFAHLIRRRRKRHISSGNSNVNSRRTITSSSLGKVYPQGPLLERYQESLDRDPSKKNFGMPALNINSMRKKRSPTADIILSAINFKPLTEIN